MSENTSTVLNAVKAINPCDKVEVEHVNDVLNWISSGEPLYRIEKPDNPSKHLVSYFVVVDSANSSLMLVDHLKAKLLLPTGGHVEVNEDPAVTVIREAKEELSIDAEFMSPIGSKPFFVTVTLTKGTGQHSDVSLWYLIKGDRNHNYEYERREFSGYSWFTFEQVLNTDIAKFDPHMHRFTKKLASLKP